LGCLFYQNFINLSIIKNSTIKKTGLVIERLQNLGSTPDAVARRCVFLGKTLNAVSHLDAKQFTRCGGPA